MLNRRGQARSSWDQRLLCETQEDCSHLVHFETVLLVLVLHVFRVSRSHDIADDLSAREGVSKNTKGVFVLPFDVAVPFARRYSDAASCEDRMESEAEW
jgi:hypothetical protein